MTRVTGSLVGGNRLTNWLAGRLVEGVLRAEALQGGNRLEEEARRLVPRETGELEEEITTFRGRRLRDLSTYNVGVPGNSPAIEKAWATEYGTWNYGVGKNPASPKTSWPAKSKEGATMPWLRTAIIRTRTSILRDWRRRLARRLRR